MMQNPARNARAQHLVSQLLPDRIRGARVALDGHNGAISPRTALLHAFIVNVVFQYRTLLQPASFRRSSAGSAGLTAEKCRKAFGPSRVRPDSNRGGPFFTAESQPVHRPGSRAPVPPMTLLSKSLSPASALMDTMSGLPRTDDGLLKKDDTRGGEF